MGRVFAVTGKYAPPPPPGVSPPHQWGDPNIVLERLGGAVRDLCFARDAMAFQILSVPHYRAFMEANVGPMTRIVQSLQADAPKLAAFRREIDDLASLYFADNLIRQDFLLTRAVKA